MEKISGYRSKHKGEKYMCRRALKYFTLLAVAIPVAATSQNSQPQARLSAAEIVDRNVAARGGQQAWQSVESMTMSGKMEAGGNRRAALPSQNPQDPQAAPAARPVEQAQLPFVMELKRPKKMRVELQYKGQTAIQVFDGANGWKLRPFLNRIDVEPYTEEEIKTASFQSELDGPLVNYAAKGTKVELAGMEKVDDNDTFKLKLTTKEGHVFHVWIDATTFLEAKIEGTPRRLDGRYHPVEIYYRDYRPVGSLKIPYVLETKVLSTLAAGGGRGMDVATEKIIFEKVEVNSRLNDLLFTRAQLDTVAGVRSPRTVPAK
jgi:hypothetical protein